jgi:type II secretory pathway pseudopilin PulG
MSKNFKKNLRKEVKTPSCAGGILCRRVSEEGGEKDYRRHKDGGISFGFTLIEVVIYIAIFSMIAITLVSLAYASARENQETINNVINAYENE